MPWKFVYTLLTLAVLTQSTVAPAALEVSLTVSGEISEIQALLNFIEERNQRGAVDSNNPLKISLHSATSGAMNVLKAESIYMPRPTRLATPQLSAEKLTPGQSALVTIAVRDDRNGVDTLAVQVVGTNLNADLYDDGTHGDVKAKDGVWSVTLTPMEATPAGRYELVVTAFDRHGQALLQRSETGEEQPLSVRTDISIER